MNQQEAAALLGIAAAFDNRKPDADAAKAWSVALEGFRFEDCRDAVVAHYRASSEWLMPQKVITEVKRIRAKRVADFGPLPIPGDMDPDDTLAYRRWLRETQRHIADAEPVDAPQIHAVPMPRELASGMARFGQMPEDTA
jgi:hypothetical protein